MLVSPPDFTLERSMISALGFHSFTPCRCWCWAGSGPVPCSFWAGAYAVRCWFWFYSPILKKMAAEISVAGRVAPPITSGRTRRHRLLFLDQHKVGAVFGTKSQVYLRGKSKNQFENWHQPRTSTSTGPALVEKGYLCTRGSLCACLERSVISALLVWSDLTV